MPQRNPFLADATRLAEGALGTLAGIRREVETMARQQVERILDSMDLVTREEFEAVHEMAANARAEQEALARRVEALEARLGEVTSSPPDTGAPGEPGSESPSEPEAPAGD